MGKQNLKLHSLEDPIVLEGILGVNKIKQNRNLKGHITGGMAVQSYLPSEINRKTVDLDFRLLWGGIKQDFDLAVEPLINHFKDNGYNVSGPKKRDVTYEMIVEKGGDSLVLQHQRAFPNNFEKHRNQYEREMANQRIINRDGITYSVLSPEDIVAHKLSRIMTFTDSYGISYPSKFNEFSADKLKEDADKIREGIITRQGGVEPREVARMRVLYDCVDIKNLAHYAGLNEKYLLESFEGFETSTKKKEGILLSGLDLIGISLSK